MQESQSKKEDKNTSGEAMIWVVLLGIILLFTAVIFYARHVTIARQENQAKIPVVARYTNYAYGVNLRFPPDWRAVGGQMYDRYEGDDGFFSIGAAGTGTETIDEIARSEVNREKDFYGTEPSIQTIIIDGQDARLVMPSPDQDESLLSQAALIVRYPRAKAVGSISYNYMVLWSNKANIQDIAASITFIK